LPEFIRAAEQNPASMSFGRSPWIQKEYGNKRGECFTVRLPRKPPRLSTTAEGVVWRILRSNSTRWEAGGIAASQCVYKNWDPLSIISAFHQAIGPKIKCPESLLTSRT
jgi:hypothetical protein